MTFGQPRLSHRRWDGTVLKDDIWHGFGTSGSCRDLVLGGYGSIFSESWRFCSSCFALQSMRKYQQALGQSFPSGSRSICNMSPLSLVHHLFCASITCASSLILGSWYRWKSHRESVPHPLFALPWLNHNKYCNRVIPKFYCNEKMRLLFFIWMSGKSPSPCCIKRLHRKVIDPEDYPG